MASDFQVIFIKTGWRSTGFIGNCRWIYPGGGQGCRRGIDQV